jgi:hypothetical protein
MVEPRDPFWQNSNPLVATLITIMSERRRVRAFFLIVAQGRREKAHDAVWLLPETRGCRANRAPTFDMLLNGEVPECAEHFDI